MDWRTLKQAVPWGHLHRAPPTTINSPANMDAYAIESVNRALRAIEHKSLAAEINPLEVDGVTVSNDEQPGKAKIDRIPTLRPAFKTDGTITAANASSISDGASALVLTRESNLNSRIPLARIVAHSTHSIHPSEFTLAPIGAIEKLLEKTRLERRFCRSVRNQ